jgi:hypothetical protein
MSAKHVFVLGTGRCGSTTMIRACQHMTNFSTGPQSRWELLFDDRLAYPQNHIEADNRLSWLLGRLHDRFGTQAYYVHLVRDREATAESFSKRFAFQPASSAPIWNLSSPIRAATLSMSAATMSIR